ncbi:hypothetical protein Tco_1512011, partial [Tanacetum coccineum]
TDKAKITRKPSKTGKHGHENGRAQKKPGNQAKVKKSKLSVNYGSTKGKTRGFSKLKVQKSNSKVQDQDGKVNTSSEVLIGGNPQGECHVTMKKAQGIGIFTLESLSTSWIATLAIHVCTYAIQRPKVDIQ